MLVSFLKICSLIFVQGIMSRYIPYLVVPLIYVLYKERCDLTFLLILVFLYELAYTNHLFLSVLVFVILYKIRGIFYKNYNYTIITNLILGLFMTLFYSVSIYLYLILIKYSVFDINYFLKTFINYVVVNLSLVLLFSLLRQIKLKRKHILYW